MAQWYVFFLCFVLDLNLIIFHTDPNLVVVLRKTRRLLRVLIESTVVKNFQLTVGVRATYRGPSVVFHRKQSCQTTKFRIRFLNTTARNSFCSAISEFIPVNEYSSSQSSFETSSESSSSSQNFCASGASCQSSSSQVVQQCTSSASSQSSFLRHFDLDKFRVTHSSPYTTIMRLSPSENANQGSQSQEVSSRPSLPWNEVSIKQEAAAQTDPYYIMADSAAELYNTLNDLMAKPSFKYLVEKIQSILPNMAMHNPYPSQ